MARVAPARAAQVEERPTATAAIGAIGIRVEGAIDVEAERKRLADEGYAPALADTEPAVVAFTTAVAAAAVAELLERMIGYGPEPRPSEILLRGHGRESATNIVAPRAGHYCEPAAGRIGAGMTQPFLEQVWPQ